MPHVQLRVRSLLVASAVIGLILWDLGFGEGWDRLARRFGRLGMANVTKHSKPDPTVLAARARAISLRGGLPIWQVESEFASTLERRIIAEFERKDPGPAQRSERFRWLNQAGVKIVGWNGRIEDVFEGVGGWVVKVRVHPALTGPSAITTTTDSYLEIYKFNASGLRLIHGVEPVPRPFKAIFGD